MEECLLSLNYIATNNKNVLPAVVVMENGDLSASKIEIKGNKNQETIGIKKVFLNKKLGVLIKKGHATITESKIHSH